MSEDLRGVVGAGGEPVAGDSPGEGVGVGGSVDLTQFPDFRMWQSQKDREIAAIRRERDALEQRLRDMESRLGEYEAELEVYRQSLVGVDEQERREIVEAAKAQQTMRRLMEENARLKRELEEQQAYREFVEYHTNAARAMGVDPAHPMFQAALATGDPVQIERAKAQILLETAMRKAARQPSEAGAAPPPTAPPIPSTHSRPPSDNVREARRAEYFRKKLELPQGDLYAQAELRRLYQDVLEPHEW